MKIMQLTSLFGADAGPPVHDAPKQRQRRVGGLGERRPSALSRTIDSQRASQLALRMKKASA